MIRAVLLAILLAPGAAFAVGGDAQIGGPGAVAGVWVAGSFACSGVLVGADRVATAAHCVDFLAPGDADATVRFGAETREVSVITLHPDAFAAPDGDLAVLWLADNAPVAALPVSREPVTEEDALIVAGWGGAEPDVPGAGVLRSFAAGVEDITETAVYIDAEAAWVCNGDSGGAVLRSGADGAELVGIVIGGTSDCEGAGMAARADRFVDFFEDPEGTPPGSLDGEDDEDEEEPEAGGAGLFDATESPGASWEPGGCDQGRGAPSSAPLLFLLVVLSRGRRP